MTIILRKLKVWYSADVVTPNGSDVSIHGEGCEEGTGADLESGWLSPDWSMTTVYEERDHVKPDRFTMADIDPVDLTHYGDPTRDHVDWLADRLSERLSLVAEYANYRSGNLYGGQDIEPDPYESIRVSICAHPVGFTPEEIERAVRICNGPYHRG